jgi:hypothetical protein
MSIFERTKRCTKKFPCRYKLVMTMCAVAIVSSIAVVPFIADMA